MQIIGFIMIIQNSPLKNTFRSQFEKTCLLDSLRKTAAEISILLYNKFMENHERFMCLALKEAAKGEKIKEVPVGCVIVRGGEIVGRGHNLKHTKGNPLLHAEIVAIQKAVKKVGDWRLNECDMYVTLEPCPMCAGAIINARIGRLFFGAFDPKAGCTGTLYNLPIDKRFNHRAEVTGGILEKECGEILTEFFRSRRNG